VTSRLTSFLRRVAALPGEDALPEGELVRRFASRRDEAAFEALLRRHGPMVWGVCRRLLRDSPDAEDAFQATFLVLVRKAGSIRRPALLSNWLYGVAYRTALKARAAALRRREQGNEVGDIPARAATPDAVWVDLRPVLDEEVRRLPAKYLAPFVLCYLEGKTNAEAARLLGCPKGTVLSRLARARQRLRGRLTRRGLTLSATALALLLTEKLAPAAVPTGLLALVTNAGTGSQQATALAEGVLKAMSMTRWKHAAVVLFMVSLLAGGAALLTYRAWPPGPAEAWGAGAPQPAPAAVWQERMTFQADAGQVFAVALSPDGKVLAAGYGKGPNNGAVKLWDTATGKEKAELRAERRLPDTPVLPLAVVESVAFSPDGKRLLATTTTNRQAVILWDAASGEQLEPLEPFVLDTRNVVFGQEGKSLAGAKYYWKEGPGGRVLLDRLEIKVWDAATGAERASVAAHGPSVSSAAFAPDNRTVAWTDTALRLWDTTTGRQRVLYEGKEWLGHVTFSPDGRTLAAVAWDRQKKAEVRRWDVATGKELSGLRAREAHIRALAFSPDGKTVATASGDKAGRLWDVVSGEQRARLGGHQSPILAVAFGPGGKTLATGSEDGTVKLWELRTGTEEGGPARARAERPAGRWGDLKGRFVYDGTPPAPKKVDLTGQRDRADFEKVGIPEESLVVAKDGGLANVLVYLTSPDVEVHPDYRKTADAKATCTLKDGRFQPHFLALRVGQTLVLSNEEVVADNVRFDAPNSGDFFNLILKPGDKAEQQLRQSMRLPGVFQSSIHPWMRGYLLVRPDPYTAVSSPDGTFAIRKLPVGKLEFRAWHERSGNVRTPAWKGGRFTVTIREGENDLGMVKLDPRLFEN
jgi:RNA polymerase sigma factor (sigma-70 family)